MWQLTDLWPMETSIAHHFSGMRILFCLQMLTNFLITVDTSKCLEMVALLILVYKLRNCFWWDLNKFFIENWRYEIFEIHMFMKSPTILVFGWVVANQSHPKAWYASTNNTYNSKTMHFREESQQTFLFYVAKRIKSDQVYQVTTWRRNFQK